jgi:hypothetical protein
MDLVAFVVLVVVAGAFFALIAWLRTSGSDLHTPGEPGDADKWPRLDGS